MSINVFSNKTLQESTNCLFWFIEIKITIQRGIKPEGIIHIYKAIVYQKVLKFIMLPSTEKAFMTK